MGISTSMSRRLPKPEHWPTIGTQRLFGKLLVLRHAGRDTWGNSYYLCICECGETREVRADKLKRGGQKSCGCLRKDPEVRRAARMKLSPERRAEIAALGGRECVADHGRDTANIMDAKLANTQSRYRALWRKAKPWIARGWPWKRIAAKIGTDPATLRRARRYMETQE
jgi:hypothetical protein